MASPPISTPWVPLWPLTPVPPVTIGTTLPASPVDGQEAILVDSLTAPTYQWHFKYVAGITPGTFKWLFIGGGPANHEILTSEATTSNAYVDLATVGPTLTVPRAGVYDIDFGCFCQTTAQNGNYGLVTVKLGAAAANANESMLVSYDTSTDGSAGNYSRRFRRTLAAGDVLKLVYSTPNPSYTVTFANRWLFVAPVRVS